MKLEHLDRGGSHKLAARPVPAREAYLPGDLAESIELSTGARTREMHMAKLAKHRSLPEAERCTKHTRRTDVRKSACSLCLRVPATTIKRSVPEPTDE